MRVLHHGEAAKQRRQARPPGQGLGGRGRGGSASENAVPITRHMGSEPWTEPDTELTPAGAAGIIQVAWPRRGRCFGRPGLTLVPGYDARDSAPGASASHRTDGFLEPREPRE